MRPSLPLRLGVRASLGARSGVALATALLLAAGLASAVDDAGFVPADTAVWPIPNPDLYAVDAVGRSAWAVGYWGAAFRSEDGGETWTRSPTPTDEALYAVSFADERHGWAGGAAGVLLQTTDGGASWQRVDVRVVDPFEGTEGPLEAVLFGVSAVSAREAWAVGDFGMVLRTRDGRTWEQVVMPEAVFADENIPDRILNAVRFRGREQGWIAGEFGTTLRTGDGGETWVGERELTGAIDDVYLFDVAANGAGWAIAGGVGGVAIGTLDGGSTWNVLDVPTTAGLFGSAVSGRRGILVGDRGVLLVSSDQGRSWAEPKRPRSFNWLRGAAFGDDGLAYVVGEDGLILRSGDGGDEWEWKLGREPPPESGISVPDPAGRARPLVLDGDQ